MQGVIVLVMVIIAVALIGLTVGAARVHRDASPNHCYGRTLSTLKSRQQRLDQVRPEKQNRPWPVRYILDPIRTAASWLFWYTRYRLRPKHRMIALDATKGEGIGGMRLGADGSTCVVMTGDWANGQANSEAVAAAIERANPHHTIHLGDIYSVGAEHEIRGKFLGEVKPGVAWPLGTFGALAVPGNHEYYSGAHAFYDVAMRRYLGLRSDDGAVSPQAATYFCLQSEQWNIIGLDTGFHSVKLAGMEALVKLINKVPIVKSTRWALALKTKLPEETLEWLRVILRDDSRAKS